MSDYSGADKLVGTLLASVGPSIVYWENVKSLDVQRVVNQIILNVQEEQQEYIGFGNQSWKDVEVHATLFIYQYAPQTLSDSLTLEGFLSQIHTIVNQYDNRTQTDTIVGNPVVWVKIMQEERDDGVRGEISYDITFQVRSLVTTTPSAAGGSTTGLTQMMLNFIGSVAPAAPPNGPWTALAASTLKSLDLQRAGNTVVVHAPTVSGNVIGIGEGLAGGQYTQQQISLYSSRLTMYVVGQAGEAAIEALSDKLAAQAPVYFLNVPFTNGLSILARVATFGQILNERGVWQRDLVIETEAIVGP